MKNLTAVRRMVVVPIMLVNAGYWRPCSGAVVGAVPVAQISEYNAVNGQLNVVASLNELGSISWNHNVDSWRILEDGKYGMVKTYFRANAYLFAVNSPTAEVSAWFDMWREAQSFARLSYAFAVKKNYEWAPDLAVPIIISGRVRASATLEEYPQSIGSFYGSASAWLEYSAPGTAGFATLPGLSVNVSWPTPSSQKAASVWVNQLPGAEGRVRLRAEYIWHNGFWSKGTVQAIADPVIQIDPDFEVFYEGNVYPGAYLYQLEFSEGFSVPEPSTLLLFGGLAGSILACARCRHACPARCARRRSFRRHVSAA